MVAPRHGAIDTSPPSRPLAAAIVFATILCAASMLGFRATAEPEAAPPDGGQPVEPAGGAPWQLPTLPLLELSPPDSGSPLYRAQVASFNSLVPLNFAGCPAPARVRDRAAWVRVVTAQWRCIHQGWAPELASLNLDASEPAVHFFDGDGAPSPCGWIEAPAFYCSTPGGGAWFGRGHFEMASAWDLSVNEMVNHEYAHHLQLLYGITWLKVALGGGPEVSRRAELQAICMSAAMTVASVPFGVDEYTGWVRRLSTMLPDEQHGSRDAMMYWGLRGLYATTYGDCNTWVEGEGQVR